MTIIAEAAAAGDAVAAATALAERIGLDADALQARVHVDPDADLRAPVAVGRSPLGRPVDERFRFACIAGEFLIHARTAAGAFRGLVREVLLGADRRSDAPDGPVCGGPVHEGPPHDGPVHDGPAIAWRGLSVDTVRYPLHAATLHRIVDLLALHGMNVLHLHLTDNEGWRAPVAINGVPGAAPFTTEELAALVNYAAQRFITVVPEIDLPGHIAALAQARPDLTARHFDHPTLAYLDPDNPAARAFVDTAISELAAIFPAPYLHIGGDEVFGMPPGAYDRFLRITADAAHAQGRRAVAWQEAVRSSAPVDLYQWWMTPADIPDESALLAKAPAGMEDLARAAAASFAEVAGDPDRLAGRGAEVIVSVQNPLYLDRRYAEPSRIPAQTAALDEVGFAAYTPTPTRDLLAWSPADAVPPGTTLAGIEAAIWGETLRSDDDLALLLLPRLALVAEKPWQPDTPAERIRRAAATARPYWAALGFDNWYRSTDLDFSHPDDGRHPA